MTLVASITRVLKIGGWMPVKGRNPDAFAVFYN